MAGGAGRGGYGYRSFEAEHIRISLRGKRDGYDIYDIRSVSTPLPSLTSTYNRFPLSRSISPPLSLSLSPPAVIHHLISPLLYVDLKSPLMGRSWRPPAIITFHPARLGLVNLGRVIVDGRREGGEKAAGIGAGGMSEKGMDRVVGVQLREKLIWGRGGRNGVGG